MYGNESLPTAAKHFTIMNERAKLVEDAHRQMKKRVPSLVEQSIAANRNNLHKKMKQFVVFDSGFTVIFIKKTNYKIG